MTRRNLQKAFNKLDRIKKQRELEVPAILGFTINGENRVEVDNRPGYVWARIRSNFNEPVKAFNDSVSSVYGLPVILVRDEIDRTRYKVKSKDLGVYQGWNGTSYLPRHGNQHSFNPEAGGAGDVVFIYNRQFVPLSVMPSGTNGAGSVQVMPYAYYQSTQWKYAGGTGTASLLPYKPTGSNARMVLVYLNGDGNPQLLAGTDYFATNITGNAAVLPYVPTLGSSTDIPLAAVRLVSGTNSILWNNIYDLRPLIVSDGFIPTGSSGHTIQDDGTPLANRAALNFVGTNFVVYNTAGATNVSGTFVSSGGGGIPERSIPVYENGTFQVTGTIINFTDDFNVIVSGSVAHISNFILQKGNTLDSIGNVVEYGDRVTIIDDSDNNGFPHVCSLPNQEMIAVYRDGTSHDSDKGIIKKRTSLDGGTTWSSEATIYSDATYDVRDPCITYLRSGRIIISFFKSDQSGPTHLSDSCYTIYSDNTGSSWSTPAQISSSFTSWDACSSPVIQLPDDTLLLSEYGLDSGDTYQHTKLFKSINDGVSWFEIGIIAESASRHYQEPNIVLLPNGVLCCILRSDTPSLAAGHFYCSFSYNWGATWTDPEDLFEATGSPRMFLTSTHLLMVIYRKNSNDSYTVAYRISRDGGYHWGNEIDLDTQAAYMTYAGATEYTTGIIGVVYSIEASIGGSNADLFFQKMYTSTTVGQAISSLISGSSSSLGSNLLIYDEHIFKVTGTAIDFVDNLSVSVTGSTAYITANPGAGGGASLLPIFDDGIFKVTGTAVSFDTNLSVSVTGTVAFVSSSGGGGGLTLISEQALISSSPTIDFNSIPGTYRNLQIICYLRSDRAASTADGVIIRFNDTSGTSYSYQRTQWNNSTTAGGATNDGGATGQLTFHIPATSSPSNHFGSLIIDVPNYISPFHKIAQAQSAGRIDTTADNYIGMGMVLWADTSVITKITLAPVNGPNFVSGSVASLYGLS